LSAAIAAAVGQHSWRSQLEMPTTVVSSCSQH
jgi:hypothetical protein